MDYSKLIEYVGILFYSIITAAFISFVQYIQRIIKERKTVKKENVYTENEADQEIQKKLIEMRVKYGCNKISIFQFHNGEYYLSNRASIKFSMTHEDTDRKSSSYKLEDFNILTSHYPMFINDLQHKLYFIYHDSDDTEFRTEMNYRMNKSCVYMKIITQTNKVVGFVKLVYDDTHVSNTVLFNSLYGDVQDLTYILEPGENN